MKKRRIFKSVYIILPIQTQLAAYFISLKLGKGEVHVLFTKFPDLIAALKNILYVVRQIQHDLIFCVMLKSPARDCS